MRISRPRYLSICLIAFASVTLPAQNLVGNPSGSQHGSTTELDANNFAGVRYVTPTWNWSQTPSTNLSIPGTYNIPLTPCPVGIDTTGQLGSQPIAGMVLNNNHYVYRVYISGGTGTAEVVVVTGGTCTSGASTGNITVTTVNSHTGYSVGSASGGIQEAINDAWNVGASDALEQEMPYVKLVAGTMYNVYSTVFLRGRGAKLDGTGAQVACYTLDICMYIGTMVGHPSTHYGWISNLALLPAIAPSAQTPVNVTAMTTTTSGSNTNWAFTGTNTFSAGQQVDCEVNSFASVAASSRITGIIQSSGLSGSAFTLQSLGTRSSAISGGSYTFGWCHLTVWGIEDNSDHVLFDNFQAYQFNNGTPPANSSFGTAVMVIDNDQAFTIRHPGNRSGGSGGGRYLLDL